MRKYDKDKNGKLEPAERETISAEDQARLRQAGMGGAWWAAVLYTVTPNWQLFWLADVLAEAKSPYPLGLCGQGVCLYGGVCGRGAGARPSCCFKNGN